MNSSPNLSHFCLTKFLKEIAKKSSSTVQYPIIYNPAYYTLLCTLYNGEVFENACSLKVQFDLRQKPMQNFKES